MASGVTGIFVTPRGALLGALIVGAVNGPALRAGVTLRVAMDGRLGATASPAEALVGTLPSPARPPGREAPTTGQGVALVPVGINVGTAFGPPQEVGAPRLARRLAPTSCMASRAPGEGAFSQPGKAAVPYGGSEAARIAIPLVYATASPLGLVRTRAGIHHTEGLSFTSWLRSIGFD